MTEKEVHSMYRGSNMKPPFPKPRLIREDFLPEKDPLINYRIKKVIKPDGGVYYYPQKKILGFWWWNLVDVDGFRSYERANNRIIEDFHETLKDTIEYLPPTNSKTVPKPPLDPPRVL